MIWKSGLCLISACTIMYHYIAVQYKSIISPAGFCSSGKWLLLYCSSQKLSRKEQKHDIPGGMNGHRYTQSTWKQIAAQPTLQLAAAKVSQVTLVAWWRCIISSKAFVHCCVNRLGPILMNKCIICLCRAWVSLQINGVSFVHYSQWPDCLAKQINWK